MLVFSRREGESFRIGENIDITILETRTGMVRIGVEAPMEIRIERVARTSKKGERDPT